MTGFSDTAKAAGRGLRKGLELLRHPAVGAAVTGTAKGAWRGVRGGIALVRNPTLIKVVTNPTVIRTSLYVGVIFGSAVVLTTSAGMMSSSFQDIATSAIGSQPKTELKRPNMPMPPVILPKPVAPQGAPVEAAEVGVEPESSIMSLGTPAAPNELLASDPTSESSSFATISAPTGDMYVLSDVTIRATPENHGKPLGSIGAGELITAVANENGWIQIARGEAVLGWVYQRFLRPAR